MLANFIRESCIVCATLGGLGLAGGFVLLPFRNTLRYGVLAAPLAGLLSIVLGVACFYSVLGRTLLFCAILSAALCCAATLIGLIFFRVSWRRLDWIIVLIAAGLVAPLATFAAEATSIRNGSPSLLYIDGTDHLGYAQLADWLSAHTVSQSPGDSPNVPYEAYPSLLFRSDPRFGSFFSLAILGRVHRLPGTFAYDFAVAVVLSAAILAVAGAFAQSPFSLLVLLAGLASCAWYDYACAGYFGKLLAYPSALMIVGLFIAAPDIRSPVVLAALTLLTAGAALMHSGLATALFFGELLGGVLLCRLWLDDSPRGPERLARIGSAAGAVVLLIVVAVVTTGILARPVQIGFPNWGVAWPDVLPRILGLENQGVRATSFVGPPLYWLTAAAFAVWLLIILAAWKSRDAAAGGLVVGPLLVLCGLLAVGGRAAAFQMIGTFFPFSVCALALLLDRRGVGVEHRPRRHPWIWKTALAILAALCIGLRYPRFTGMLDRYAGRQVPAVFQYSLRDTDRLTAAIDRQSVEVEADQPQQAIFALVELSRRGIPLRWSPKSWQTIVGYTFWPAPHYDSPARFKLVMPPVDPAEAKQVVCRTAQFDLLDSRK